MAHHAGGRVRHPGHEPQSVHGSWAKKKLGTDLTGVGRPRPAKDAKPKRARLLSPAAAAALQQQMTANDPWTDAGRKALRDYSANEYLLMNSELRGVRPRAFNQWITDADPQATKRRITDAYGALRPLPQPIRVFRNTNAEGLGLQRSYSRDEEVRSLLSIVGTKLQERGFSSTSAKRLKAGKKVGDRFGSIRLDIEVTPGVRAAYIESITTQKRKGEHEFVLEPGLTYEFLDLDDSADLPTLKVRVSRP